MSVTDRERLVAAFSAVAAEYADRLASTGADLDMVGGVGRVTDLVRAVLPRVNRFADRVGPVYATGQLSRLLPGAAAPPISDEAVRDRQRNGRLIGFKTAEGRWAWPAWQFSTAPGRLVPREDVLTLWRLLPADGPSELTRVAWLTGEHRELDGHSPLSWLDRRGLDDRVRAVARRWAVRVAA